MITFFDHIKKQFINIEHIDAAEYYLIKRSDGKYAVRASATPLKGIQHYSSDIIQYWKLPSPPPECFSPKGELKLLSIEAPQVEQLFGINPAHVLPTFFLNPRLNIRLNFFDAVHQQVTTTHLQDNEREKIRIILHSYIFKPGRFPDLSNTLNQTERLYFEKLTQRNIMVAIKKKWVTLDELLTLDTWRLSIVTQDDFVQNILNSLYNINQIKNMSFDDLAGLAELNQTHEVHLLLMGDQYIRQLISDSILTFKQLFNIPTDLIQYIEKITYEFCLALCENRLNIESVYQLDSQIAKAMFHQSGIQALISNDILFDDFIEFVPHISKFEIDVQINYLKSFRTMINSEKLTKEQICELLTLKELEHELTQLALNDDKGMDLSI